MKELYPAFLLHIISFHGPRYTPDRSHEVPVSCLPLTHYFFSWPTLYTWSLSWRSCILPSTYSFLFVANVIPLVAVMKERYPAFHLHIISFHGPRYTPGRYHVGGVPWLPLSHFFSWPTLYTWSLSWRSFILPSNYTLFLFVAYVIPLVAIMKELYPAFHLHIILFHGPRYTPGRYHDGAVSCLPLTHYFISWPTLYSWSLSCWSSNLPSTYTLFYFMAHVIPLVAIMMDLYPAFHLHIILFHGPRYTPGRYHDGALSCLPLTHYCFSWPTLYPWSLSWWSCTLPSTYTLFLFMTHVIHLVAIMKKRYPAFHLHIYFHGPRYTPGRYHEGAVSCLSHTHFISWPTLYPWSLSWRSCILPSTYTLFLSIAHVIPLVAIMKELYPAFLLHIISIHGPRYSPGRYHEGAVSCLPLIHYFLHGPRYTSGRYHEGAVSCLPLTHYFFSWPSLYTWSLSWSCFILHCTYTLFLFIAHVIPLVAIMKELYPAFHLHIISLHGPHYTSDRYHGGGVSCLPLTLYSFSWSTLYRFSLSWRSFILPSTYTLFLFMTHVIPMVAVMKVLYPAFH